MSLYHLISFFFIYGFLGWCTEVGYAAVKEHKFVNRGFLNGPICPIYGVGVSIVIAFLSPFKDNLLLLYVSSVILVSLLEGVTGWAMDKIFHNKWWDYSSQPLNIGGYVCLIFSLIWGVACVFIMVVFHPLVTKFVEFIPHTLGLVLLAVLMIVLFVDLYVTSSTIFKFNRRMAHMDKIAGELHEISDQIGSEIYEAVVFAMEKQEDAVEYTQGVSADVKARLADLRKRYQELGSSTAKVGRRFMKAFPKMQSRKYTLQLDEMRKRLSEKMKR